MLDSPAALAWVANYGAIELHPWTSTCRSTRTQADVGDDRHRSRTKTSSFDDVLVLARLHRTATGAPRRQGDAEGDRAARHPDLGARRGALHVRRHARVGREALAHDRASRCPTSSAGSGKSPSAAARCGSTTPRTRSTRRSSRRSAPGPPPGAPVSVPITWDELDDPDLRPDAWTIETIGERLAAAGDPLAPLIGLRQRLPQL